MIEHGFSGLDGFARIFYEKIIEITLLSQLNIPQLTLNQFKINQLLLHSIK